MTRLIKLSCWSLLLAGLVSCKNSGSKTEATENELETDGVEQAMWQEFRMTRDPQLNVVPRERLNSAIDYLNTMTGYGRLQALTWQERGPNNIGGRTRAIMIDKRDATGNTVFAGSVGGGLFKTTNFLSATPTWTPINDMLPNLAITCLVQSSSNTNEMYAGTGEGWFNIDAIRGSGIYKSTDGGVTWNVLPSTIIKTPTDSTYEYVQDMVFDINGNLYASLKNANGAARGVRRSTNGGTTWVQVLGAPLINPSTGATFTTGRAADLEVAANGDVYATLGILGRTIVMKSSFAIYGAYTGAVNNWTEVTPVRGRVTQRAELAIAPSNSQRLYIIEQDSANNQVVGMYRSNDGGANWDSMPTPTGINNGVNSQAWYNMILAVDPSNADVVYAGGLHIAKSTDAGATWSQITNNSTVHVDQHVLLLNGSSNLIAGNDGGIYYSSNANTASPTFANKNITGFNVTQFYAVDYHPSDANYFLAGAQDNNTQKFTTAGMNSTSPVVGGDGGVCHIDQSDGGQIQIAATTGNNYYISTNGGNSFSAASGNNSRGQFINPGDYDYVNNILYAGDDAGMYYTLSGIGSSLSPLQVSLSAMGTLEATAIKVDPVAANTIWIGASYGTPSAQAPRVIKVSNANTSTPSGVATVLAAPANAAISCIDVDPANTNRVLVTLSNFGVTSVFYSTDGGTTFNSIEGNLPDMPVRWGLFAPANAQLNGTGGGNGGIILGTELGVWTTSAINGTSTVWIPNNSGLANVSTYMVKLRPSDNTLIAATHGRGLFTATVPTVVTGVPAPAITKNFIKYSSASGNQLLIVKGSLQTQTMTVQLLNMQGQLVYKTQNRYQDMNINIGNLQSGVYVLRITGDKKENYVQQFIKK